jgi:hypothetical protein
LQDLLVGGDVDYALVDFAGVMAKKEEQKSGAREAREGDAKERDEGKHADDNNDNNNDTNNCDNAKAAGLNVNVLLSLLRAGVDNLSSASHFSSSSSTTSTSTSTKRVRHSRTAVMTVLTSACAHISHADLLQYISSSAAAAPTSGGVRVNVVVVVPVVSVVSLLGADPLPAEWSIAKEGR